MNDLTHISVEFYIPISHILCGNTKALKSFSYLIWTIFAKYNGQLLHSFSHSFSSVESHKPIFSPFLIIKMKTWENMEQHLDLQSSTSMADTLALFSPILPSPRYPYAKCSADSSWVNREWEKDKLYLWENTLLSSWCLVYFMRTLTVQLTKGPAALGHIHTPHQFRRVMSILLKSEVLVFLLTAS